jgi:hypothetical protein
MSFRQMDYFKSPVTNESYAARMAGTMNARLEYYLDRIREAENAAAKATDVEKVAAWKQVAAGYQFLLNRLSGTWPRE